VKRAKSKPVDVERMFFDTSLGGRRLMDTVIVKGGDRELAQLPQEDL
jgi:hypothetical protein